MAVEWDESLMIEAFDCVAQLFHRLFKALARCAHV